MKQHFLVFTFLLLSSLAFGQHYEAGKSNLSAGLGVGGYADRGGLPIWLCYEYGFGEWFSAGAMSAYQYWEVNYSGIGKYTYSATFFAARGSVHFSKFLKIDQHVDLYGGLGLGYISYNETWNSSNNSNRPARASLSSNFLGVYFGAKYFFNKNQTIGANAELGYGLSPLLVGICFKF
jgi:hypothetical protein